MRIETGGRLVQDQDVGIVNDRLGQADALPVAFGKLADQRLPDVGDGALFRNFVDPSGQVAAWERP